MLLKWKKMRRKRMIMALINVRPILIAKMVNSYNLSNEG